MCRTLLTAVIVSVVALGLAQSPWETLPPSVYTSFSDMRYKAWIRPHTTAGLQLKVVATKKPGNADAYRFKAQLTNTTNRDVELVTIRDQDETTPPLENYLVRATTFHVTPKVHGTIFSFAAPIASEILYRIPARQTVQYEWDSYCNCLLPPGDDWHDNPFSACLPEPGIYTVQAEFEAVTRQEEWVSVKAAPFEISNGSSDKPAKPTSIKVVSLDADGIHASVEPGRVAGLKLGEEYMDGPKGAGWQLRIVDLNDHSARVEVKEISHDSRRKSSRPLPIGKELFRIDQVKKNGSPKCESRHEKYSFGKI